MKCAFCGRTIASQAYWNRFCDALCAVDFNTNERDQRPFHIRESELLEAQETEPNQTLARLMRGAA
jgi:hypothetical protein